MNEYPIKELGNILKFEEYIGNQAYDEFQKGHTSMQWRNSLKGYIAQKEAISVQPYADSLSIDYPTVKRVILNLPPRFDKTLYRWRLESLKVGNWRILYKVHNYHTILLLHGFHKDYNGAIRTNDIQKAINVLQGYLEVDPDLY